MRFIWTTLFLLPLLTCSAQKAGAGMNATVRRFGVEDGLPHRQINCVMQDRRGFIWVASVAGMSRFDGYRFLNFNKTENGLSEDRVDWLAEDASNDIWIIRMGIAYGVTSIDIFDPVSQKVVPIEQVLKKKPPFPLQDLSGVCMTKPGGDGTLIFGKNNPSGFATYHPSRGWQTIDLPAEKFLRIIKVTSRNTFWGLTNRDVFDECTLVEMDTSGKVLHQYRPQAGRFFVSWYGNTAEADGFRLLECSTPTDFTVWEIQPDGTRQAVSFPEPTIPSYGVLSDLSSGYLLVNQTIYAPNGSPILHLDELFPELHGRVNLFFLREWSNPNHFWVGTDFGLILLDLHNNRFERFLYDEKGIFGNGIPCRGIVADNGTLWVNTDAPEKGYYKVDLKTRKTTSSGEGAYAIYRAPNGKIWIDSHLGLNGQLLAFDPVTGKTSTELLKGQFDYNWSIFQDKPDRILLGGSFGLTLFNPENRVATKKTSTQFPEFNGVHISWLCKDHAGNIWACTTKGLFLLDESAAPIARFWTGGTGDQFLPTDSFTHLHEDANGVFWLGTPGNGLLRWDKKTGQKELFDRKCGLLNNFVYAVYEDGFGHFWLPTDYGIAQFDKKTQTVRRTWLPADGVAQFEFNRIAHFQAADGTLYFGGLNGVTAFNPKNFYEVEQSGSKRTLVLSDFQLYSDRSGKTESRMPELLRTGATTVLPGDRYLQFDFALLDFFNNEKTTYSWRIEGFGEDWNYQVEPFLRMPSLPYGTHKLSIRAQAADGQWAANELHFTINALPPVYLRWWFLILAAAALAVGAYLLYRLRTREHRRRAEALREEVSRQTATIQKQSDELRNLDEFKSQVYANITHEFRTPLTIILGTAEQLANEEQHGFWQKKLALIQKNGHSLLNLVNQLLDLSKAEFGKLDIQPVQGDVRRFIAYLIDNFRGMTTNKRIELAFHCADPEIVMDYDAEKLRQIMDNLLSNALKHTPPGGKIEVNVQRQSQFLPQNLIIEVVDTGTGISEEDQPRIFDRFFQGKTPVQVGGTGLGLALVKELAKLHGGSVQVNSKLGKGATFTVSLPIFNRAPIVESVQPQSQSLAFTEIEQVGQGDETDISQGAAQHQKPKILLVEDNPDVLIYLRECLENRFQIDVAENGRIGIERTLKIMPELILSDLMMPEIDGLQLCKTLKNDKRTSHIPIVLLTARADIESRLAGLERGADAYLAKPFDRRELMLVLENILTARRRMQEKFQPKNWFAAPNSEPSPLDTPATTLPSQEDFFMEKIGRFLEENLGNSALSLDDICRKAGMGRTHLNAKMIALTGSSPMQYLRLLRLERAKVLLAETGAGIADVAYEVGFEDPKYFSRVFSEAFGMPPSAFKND